MPKIKGKDHLIKDEYSQAVINTDRDAYTLYKKRKIIMQSKNKEIETLKVEMSELKVMMTQILDKCNGKEC
ncbi:MAG: hypothetical protein CMK35_09600 [Porticoccaceae bacterium]|nr:hypothetical protein [Porticoccaceae bacterium]